MLRLTHVIIFTLPLLLVARVSAAPVDAAPEMASVVVREVATAPVVAASSMPQAALQDQVWMVSTRLLGFPRNNCDPRLRVSCWDGCKKFHPSTLEQLLASDDPRYTTVIYVHGNRIEPPHARSTGFEAYRMLKCGCRKPLRLIIWSWPSGRVVYRTLRDCMLKLERTVAEEYYLAWFMAKMNPHRPLSLIGYSFGGRICAGALQLRAGGALEGYRLKNPRPVCAPVQLTLIAAAADKEALTPCGKYPQMLRQVSRVLVLYNKVDPALLFYPLLEPKHPTAVGRVGPLCCGASACKIRSHECSSIIGHSHSVHRYFETPELMRLINSNVHWGN